MPQLNNPIEGMVKMDYAELLAENDKNLQRIAELEKQLKPANIRDFITFAAIEDMSTKQINEVFCDLHESCALAENKIKNLEDKLERLERTFENQSLNADSHLTAADCYFEIGDILQTDKDGGSVIDSALIAVKKIKAIEKAIADNDERFDATTIEEIKAALNGNS